MRVLVVGGGPAGMMAAIQAAKQGNTVTLLEQNEKLGKKLFITGKGRCNVTNDCDVTELFDSVVSNKKFLYSAFYSFSNQDVKDFFEEQGLRLKVERGRRVFPASDKSSDVIKALGNALKKLEVKIRLRTRVDKVLTENDIVCGVRLSDGECLNADKVILPGVGAFGDAMGKLRQYGLDEVIRDVTAKGTPFLGICLGLQLLFERSDETPGVEGLGILKGEILRIPDQEGLKIPHMGWNSLKFQNNGRLFKDIPEDSYVYFVHSYYLKAEDEGIVTATTEYSTHIHASVEQGNVFACQFHPEKSSDIGIQILKNFVEL